MFGSSHTDLALDRMTSFPTFENSCTRSSCKPSGEVRNVMGYHVSFCRRIWIKFNVGIKLLGEPSYTGFNPWHAICSYLALCLNGRWQRKWRWGWWRFRYGNTTFMQKPCNFFSHGQKLIVRKIERILHMLWWWRLKNILGLYHTYPWVPTNGVRHCDWWYHHGNYSFSVLELKKVWKGKRKALKLVNTKVAEKMFSIRRARNLS